MIKLIPILLFVGLTCGGDVDGRDKLETAILGLIQGFNGDVGVYVRHLSSNTAVGVNAVSYTHLTLPTNREV